MGIYDLVLGMQVKATSDPCMHNYTRGDAVPLDDGAYLCFEGVFIVKHGKVVEGSTTVFNKWGDTVDIYELLHAQNPVTQALEQVAKKKGLDAKFAVIAELEKLIKKVKDEAMREF